MKYRHLIVGAGRIGAGFQWNDMAYTHAGASQALSDRIELVGFVEPDEERAAAAKAKWHLPAYHNIAQAMERQLETNIVSVCVQPHDQEQVFIELSPYTRLKGIWCEKPMFAQVGGSWPPIQVNYLRRADKNHQIIAQTIKQTTDRELVVMAKDDIHTRCHFEDLAEWWGARLHYVKLVNQPCSYVIRCKEAKGNYAERLFTLGGIDAGKAMRNMLGNLLDHLTYKTPLWSPPHA